MKRYIVIMWGEEGLTNEIGFNNFWRTCKVAYSINPDAYIGWHRPTETACIVVPIKKNMGKAIGTLLEFNPISDIRIMSDLWVDNEIAEVDDEA